MTKIFVGFLFVFLNFNFTLNDTYVINLLPDFVGFILLYMGTRELLEESPRYTTAGPWLLGLTAYGIASWVINLLGLNGGWVISLLTLVAAAVTYYATWLVIKGHREKQLGRERRSGKYAQLEDLCHSEHCGGGAFLGAGAECAAAFGHGGGDHYAAGEPEQDPQAV